MNYEPESFADAEDYTVGNMPLALDISDPQKAKELKAAAEQNLYRLKASKVNYTAASRYKTSRYDMAVPLTDGTALLFNSRTRSLVLLAKEEAELYNHLASQGAFPPNEIKDPILAQVLADGGHILGTNIDELTLVRFMYDAARSNNTSLNLTIAPTMACNFACGYCFQGLNKPTKKMSSEVEDAIINFVKAKSDLRSLNVVWYGGEPLMGKESIFKISDSLIAYCDMKGIVYTAGIVSNAYFLTGSVAGQLHSRRVKWVQITLDGDKDTHNQMRPLTSGGGTYDKILDNMAATLDATPMAINVRVNVGLRNIDNVSHMLDVLVERKFARRPNFVVYFAPIEASTPESGSAFEEKMIRAEFNRAVLGLEEKARKLGFASTVAAPTGFLGMCVAASKGGYVLTANGDVHKCWETAHDASKRTGTIFEPEKLHSSVNATIWQQWTPFDNDTCKSCKILPMCGGHCAHRFIYGGPDQTALPCPSWKWNTAEYIFSRAKDLGIVTQDKWREDQATVDAKQSGERHSKESLEASQAFMLQKVGKLHRKQLTREMLLEGEAALEAVTEPAQIFVLPTAKASV
jgi:uncharacterized protein